MEKKNIHFTKQKLYQQLAKKTGLTKKTIDLIFVELLNIIRNHMKIDGPEKFVLPGFFKITTKYIPAQEEKVGVNPFTKQNMIFKAKPGYRKLKIKILKNLRDTVKN